MTIPNVSSNSLVDQTLLNSIIDEVNGVSSKFANTISPIYDTSTKTVVNSYMGTFAIATNFTSGNIKGSGSQVSASQQISISFNKTFLSAPLIFPSVSFKAGTPGVHVPGINIIDVNKSGCTIVVTIYSSTTFTNEVGFDLSVMAVGLTQL